MERFEIKSPGHLKEKVKLLCDKLGLPMGHYFLVAVLEKSGIPMSAFEDSEFAESLKPHMDVFRYNQANGNTRRELQKEADSHPLLVTRLIENIKLREILGIYDESDDEGYVNQIITEYPEENECAIQVQSFNEQLLSLRIARAKEYQTKVFQLVQDQIFGPIAIKRAYKYVEMLEKQEGVKYE